MIIEYEIKIYILYPAFYAYYQNDIKIIIFHIFFDLTNKKTLHYRKKKIW